MIENGFALVNTIVSWGNSYSEDIGPSRPAGRGRICATIPSNPGPYFVVEVIPRAGDDEPPHQVIIHFDEAGLNLFSTLEAEELWFAWVMSDGKDRVVSLVRPSKPTT